MKAQHIRHSSRKVTKLILYGSLFVSLVLTTLLLTYDILLLHELRIRSYVALFIILYLITCWILARKERFQTVNWMLIFIYTLLAFSTMLYWGLNAAVGIFSTSFVIILAGILLGSRAIFPVSIFVTTMLFLVQTLHSTNIISPNLSALHEDSTFLDVIAYVTVLGIFALIIWISDSQTEKAFQRAKAAETSVRTQKETIAFELEQESAKLRQTQLVEMQQLYKFATLGQSTAATLHELSNHLSVLNLDIDDIKQQHRNSRAIENAQEGIDQINLMVRQVRRKLNAYDTSKVFKVGIPLKRSIQDQLEKAKAKSIHVIYEPNFLEKTPILGDPLALNQILTVLLSNAIEACVDLPNAKIIVKLAIHQKHLQISVIDNGIGVNEQYKHKLFLPTLSSKPTGLGVGLFIANHLAESHFQGKIKLVEKETNQINGAHFILEIPLIKS